MPAKVAVFMGADSWRFVRHDSRRHQCGHSSHLSSNIDRGSMRSACWQVGRPAPDIGVPDLPPLGDAHSIAPLKDCAAIITCQGASVLHPPRVSLPHCPVAVGLPPTPGLEVVTLNFYSYPLVNQSRIFRALWEKPMFEQCEIVRIGVVLFASQKVALWSSWSIFCLLQYFTFSLFLCEECEVPHSKVLWIVVRAMIDWNANPLSPIGLFYFWWLAWARGSGAQGIKPIFFLVFFVGLMAFFVRRLFNTCGCRVILVVPSLHSHWCHRWSCVPHHHR